ncbi:MAG: Uracil-DNA glycosylase [Chlamydiae bacterium]|nr:Uracil-DNA glycosylase [Chlamydiota bacterium]
MTMFTDQIPLLNDWQDFFRSEFNQDYFKKLEQFLTEEINKEEVFPPRSLVFNSFFQTPLSQVKVVIMGQDPYHGPGQAHGLSFSVSQGVPPPPSLKNIFKELLHDLHLKNPPHGCLLSWAQQGVLLLNATLTVRRGEAKSHHGRGWEVFTDHVIQKLAALDQPIVFLLWGRSAQEKCLHFFGPGTNSKHLVLKTTHPSPFSAYSGFLGSRHFSLANEFLKKQGLSPVDWSVC